MKKLYKIFLGASAVFVAHAAETTLNRVKELQEFFDRGQLIEVQVFDPLRIESLGADYLKKLGALYTRNLYRIAQNVAQHDNLQSYFQAPVQNQEEQKDKDVIRAGIASGAVLQEIEDFESAACDDPMILKRLCVHEIRLKKFKQTIADAKVRIMAFDRAASAS